MPLDAYAALIDWSDVFVSGDTGPLHMAAAWKKARKEGHVFRNRSGVVGIFGATPPRLSGYDSLRWDFLETEQKILVPHLSIREFMPEHHLPS